MPTSYLEDLTIIKKLVIKRGDHFQAVYKFTNPDGSDKDWTGATGRAYLRTLKDKAYVDNWQITFGSEGQVTLLLTDVQTREFPHEILESDLEIVEGGSRLTYVHMRIFVSPDVTY